MKTEKDLYNYIINSFEESNINYDTNVGIGGVEPDFLIFVPDGRKFSVDLKYWNKFDGFTNLAAKQSEHYSTDIGVDRSFIVINDLERSNTSTGVVTPEKLIPTILNEMSKKDVKQKTKQPSIRRSPKKEIFAAMPFDIKYQDVYFVAMAEAADRINAVCNRVDQEEFSGDIVEKIKSMINTSVAVIADLSESNPNVMYEVGYAHGKKKPTVHICSTPLKELPFDVAQWNTISYRRGQTYKLGEKIYTRLKELLD
ncbi:MAG: hypothetical protein WBB69_06270 [Anaerolineales bacterium]